MAKATKAQAATQPQTAARAAEALADRLWTRWELAVLLGQHPQTIVKWERDGMPIAVRGSRGLPSKYRLADVWRWALEKARGGATSGELSLSGERARLAEVQRAEAELRVQTRKGELLERADVAKVWGEQITNAKTELRGIPHAVADRCVQVARTDGASGVERVLAQVIDDALRGLAQV
jgi:phage terminase Nu1 subunit (DNA packaging protein)